MKKTIAKILTLVFILSLMLASAPAALAAGNPYVHNPVLNPACMEDVIVDPNAVYGFRPDPESTRLGSFADADWDDPVKVAEWKQQRIDYHNDFATMYATWETMEAAGEPIENIARTVSGMRNEIRLASYKNDPEGLEMVKEANLKKYGNENGPTADSLFEKYGSWETVLMKSFSENPGMDACLGLYDDYYENYVMLGTLQETHTQTFVVRAGDYLCKIAEKYFGTAAAWYQIYQANRDQIKDPNLIYVGQTLKIIL